MLYCHAHIYIVELYEHAVIFVVRATICPPPPFFFLLFLSFLLISILPSPLSCSCRDMELSNSDLGNLPDGWEIRYTSNGRRYFVNHANRTTQFTGELHALSPLFVLVAPFFPPSLSIFNYKVYTMSLFLVTIFRS